jgi:hypothetical protein
MQLSRTSLAAQALIREKKRFMKFMPRQVKIQV